MHAIAVTGPEVVMTSRISPVSLCRTLTSLTFSEPLQTCPPTLQAQVISPPTLRIRHSRDCRLRSKESRLKLVGSVGLN